MSTPDIQSYYEILGINANTSVHALKLAYRSKAKQYHPDINKDPGAHDHFVKIIEAYEYLLALKTGKIKPTYVYEDRAETMRQAAREKAEAYSKMRYEAYVNSKDYKVVSALEIIESFGLMLFSIFCIGLPIAFAIAGQWVALWIALGLNLTMLPITTKILRHGFRLSITKLLPAIKYIVSLRIVRFTALSIFNLVVVVKIGLQTLVPFSLILALVTVSILLAWQWAGKKGFTGSKRSYYCFAMAPALISCLLCFNFYIGFNQTTETYNFTTKRKSTLIYLEGDAYEEYPGVRVFMSYDELAHGNLISYTFHTGLLGVRVMRSYRFH